MATPNKTTGVHDITIERRSTFPLELSLTANGSVWDITGYSFIAQVWNPKRTVKYADFAVDYVDRANGKINFKLTPEQTETFKLDTLRYDIKYKESNNDEKYLIEGTIYMIEGYSDFA